MDTRLPVWSATWSGYGGCDDDVLEDYCNNNSLAVASQLSMPPLDRPYYSSGEPDLAYPQMHLVHEECELLHPQPGLVSRATFMMGDEKWRRPSFATHSDESVGSPTISSAWSNGHSSPDIIRRSPTRSSSILPDDVSHTCGGFEPLSRHDSHASMTCVALQQVQTLADDLPDAPVAAFSDDSHTWSADTYNIPYTADDGYVPMTQNPDQENSTPDTYLSTSNSSKYQTQGTSRRMSEEEAPVRVNIRRRRQTASSSIVTAASDVTVTSPRLSGNRVSKRPAPPKHRSSSYRSNRSTDEANERPGPANKIFPCPFTVYGCPSTFGSKNEWKRHIKTQHMRLDYWRCKQCADANGDRKPNDFNRKDLFVQHVRRMHNSPNDMDEDQYLTAEAERCHGTLRQLPESSSCLVCNDFFRGRNSWEQRIEHVATHFDGTNEPNTPAAHDPQQWHADHNLEQYLLREGIIVRTRGRLVLPELVE